MGAAAMSRTTTTKSNNVVSVRKFPLLMVTLLVLVVWMLLVLAGTVHHVMDMDTTRSWGNKVIGKGDSDPKEIVAITPWKLPTPELTPSSGMVHCGTQMVPSCQDCVDISTTNTNRGKRRVTSGYCTVDCEFDVASQTCIARRFLPFQVQTTDETAYLYDLLVAVTDAFQAANISYVLTAGTLMGVFRTNPPGMIRWDDDLDLAVPASDYPTMHKLLLNDPEQRFTIHNHRDEFYKIGLANRTTTLPDAYGMDIWQLSYMDWEKQGKAWRHVNLDPTQLNLWFTGFYYTQQELFPTRPCAFYDKILQCPAGAISHLRRSYGDNFMTTFQTSYHRGLTIRFQAAGTNLNDHSAYLPAMTEALMQKLMPNPNVQQ